MILGYLILAHILGDFIFQPDMLVKWKAKNIVGIFLHVLIHFIVSSAILLPFILNGYSWYLAVIFGICFIHFWIDFGKIKYEKKYSAGVFTFIVDQILHVIVIYAAYLFMENIALTIPETKFYAFYKDPRIIFLFSLLILVYFVQEIYRFTKDREKTKILTRTIAVIILYGFFLAINFYAPVERLL